MMMLMIMNNIHITTNIMFKILIMLTNTNSTIMCKLQSAGRLGVCVCVWRTRRIGNLGLRWKLDLSLKLCFPNSKLDLDEFETGFSEFDT